MKSEIAEMLLLQLERSQPVIRGRDSRYRGETRIRFTRDEVAKDLNRFGVNLCRLAVTSVAERIRVKRLVASVKGRDVSVRANQLWALSDMDQNLEGAIIDALAVGAAYLIVWKRPDGLPSVWVESAEQVTVKCDPVTRETVAAVKRWYSYDELGVQTDEYVMLYEQSEITLFKRSTAGRLEVVWSDSNPLGVVPVVPLINRDRPGDSVGYSIIDDLADLVDALNKTLADMLTTSEAVARPKRWVAGVDLEEDVVSEGFTADGPTQIVPAAGTQPAKSPFADGNQMWVTESPEAKFGQLPGADLNGYRSAVDLLVQQIMAVSSLPAHMIGVTTANPTSADSIRAAEAGLTAKAESRQRVLGTAIEYAIRLLLAIDHDVQVSDVGVQIKWANAATRSIAQEADAVLKLVQVGVMTIEEARDLIDMGL